MWLPLALKVKEWALLPRIENPSTAANSAPSHVFECVNGDRDGLAHIKVSLLRVQT